MERVWNIERACRAIQAGGRYNNNYKSDLSEAWLRNQASPFHFDCTVRIENIVADASGKEILEQVHFAGVERRFKGRGVVAQWTPWSLGYIRAE
jgi:hypothetical protein